MEDFIGDPIVFEDDGEKRAQDPDHRPPVGPVFLQCRAKEGELQEIDSGVAEVGEQSEKREGSQTREGECRRKMRPAHHNPDDADGEEDEVVVKAAGFPKAQRPGRGGGSWCDR
jgi:hypothetical protein